MQASLRIIEAMSARTLLAEEIARAPESVVQGLLVHLRSVLPQKLPDPPGTDYFETYWSQLYGSLKDVEWAEPAELPYEKREEW